MSLPPIQPVQPRSKSVNGLAIAALVCGIIAIVPVALILGIVALVQIKKRGQAGRGLAIGGIVAAAGWTVLAVVLVVVLVSNIAERDASGRIVDAGLLDELSLRVGDCINDPDEDDLLYSAVPCADRHDAEIFARFALEGDGYPGGDAVRRRANAGCAHRFEDSYGRRPDARIASVTFFSPDRFDWALDDHDITCFANFAPRRAGALPYGASTGAECDDIALGADRRVFLLVQRTKRMPCAEGARVMEQVAETLGGDVGRVGVRQIAGYTCRSTSPVRPLVRITCRDGDRSVTAVTAR